MIAMSTLTALDKKKKKKKKRERSEQESRASFRSLTLCASYTNTKWPASHTVETRCQLKLVLKWAKSPGWHRGPVGKQLFTLTPHFTASVCGRVCACVCTLQDMHSCVCCLCTIYIGCRVPPLTRAASLPPCLTMMLWPSVAWLRVAVSWRYRWCCGWLYTLNSLTSSSQGDQSVQMKYFLKSYWIPTKLLKIGGRYLTPFKLHHWGPDA